MSANRGGGRKGGGKRETHAKAQVNQEMAMRRGGDFSSRPMLTDQRRRIRVGETTVAVQPDKKVHLGRTK
eukprot:4846032-Prorocentrum_lima.AAC.1